MENRRIAKVSFEDGKGWTYDFFTDLDYLVEKDKLVVDTRNGLAIATFVEYVEESDKASAWVVQKINMKRHTKRIKKYRKYNEIKSAIINRVENLGDYETYKILAKGDPIIKGLVEELDRLNEE